VDQLKVEILLSRPDEKTGSSKRTLHTLDKNVSPTDVRPPKDILHAILSRVEMDIIIASTQDDSTASGKYHPVRRSLLPTCNPQQPDESQSIPRRGTDPSDLDMLDHGAFEPSIHMESWLSEPDHITLADLQQTMPTIDNTTEELEGIWKLVELLLSTAFCGRPKRLSKGFSFTQRSLRPLVVVAPFVWCPRTLPWLAERTPFLPTIAHAVSGVMSHRCNSLSTYTSQRFFETVTPNVHDYERWKSPQPQSLHGHLWKLLQGQAIRSPPASFGLLRGEGDTAQEEADSQDDILDAYLNHNAAVALEADATVSDVVCGESNEWSDEDLFGSLSGTNCCEPHCDETAEKLTHQSLNSFSQSTIDSVDTAQPPDAMTHNTVDEKPTNCLFPDTDDFYSVCSSLEMLSLPDVEADRDFEDYALVFGDATGKHGSTSAWA
jgi:hypothetical protein